MREGFAATDTRLPPLERARLGARGSVFASPKVNGLYDLLFAEAWPVKVNPARFRLDEARLQVMARIAGILGDLEAAIRRELGADHIPPKTRPAPLDAQRSATGGDLLAGSRALRIGLRTWAISLGI